MRARRREFEFDDRMQVRGGCAGKPLRSDAALERRAFENLGLAELEIDLEPVRHHGFDLHGPGETRSADKGCRGPVAGDGIWRGLELEGIELAGRRGVRRGLHELVAR